MLAATELAELYRSHRNETLLSVYLDTDQQDFAERGKWRLALKNHVAEQRSGADDPARFDQAFARLGEVLDLETNHFLSGRGWVGFATPDEILYAESIPVPMPNLVRWETGIRVAPYARALKQSRPIVAVLIDSRRARLLRYKEGALEQQAELEADTYLGDISEMSVAKRASNTSGVRGQTGTDAAQRFLDVERDRLVARVAEEVRAEAGREGFVVVGGAARTVDALVGELDGALDGRCCRVPGLTFDLTEADLRGKVEAAASDLSAGEGRGLLERLLEAGPDGAACLGDEDTARALVEKRVGTLIVSDTLRDARPDRTDHLEGAAWEQGADIVELSGDAAAELDRRGEGVGALLRYRL